MPRDIHEPERPQAAISAASAHAEDLFRLPNVTGVGAGYKISDGRRSDTVGVTVYVTHKEPSQNLAANELVPGHLTIDGERIPTDVVEVGRLHFCDDLNRYRPLRGGCRITSNYGAGTAGGVFVDRLPPKKAVLLTNNHVLTDKDHPDIVPVTPFNLINQPSSDIVGKTTRIVPAWLAPLGADYAHEAVVDAGIVEIAKSVDQIFEVVDIAGKHPHYCGRPYLGLKVVFRGSTSGQVKTGTVTGIGCKLIIEDKSTGFKRRLIGAGLSSGGTGFVIQFNSDSVSSLRGDSGSLVVDADGKASRGLLFAGTGLKGGYSYACDIIDVMYCCDITTPLTGAMYLAVSNAVDVEFAGIANRHDLVDDHVDKFERFRVGYILPGEGILSGAFELLLQGERGAAIADSLLVDDDFAGLVNRAIGPWVIQPNIFEMLDYRIPAGFTGNLLAAFARLNHIRPGTVDLSWWETALNDIDGRTIREVLGRRVRTLELAAR
ncbi:hypothetical protein J7E99_39610 [Streptomyces sp. ISL-44]|uniref:hypothetical protein n=1 Tax=Streptomyces sp. ISL-44 TaxID=2819184 RepID=UPI001BE9D72C|nr:hypothetical protein [Streptomyces sp. ISL-44]MBT2546600.1 hypothetical protein [Streptomyces sp. ISL-44]